MAINIPLALLFAFSVLFLRGKSANLLSIGAVDFGIIVDSSVIMVENIYRRLSAGEKPNLPLKERILQPPRDRTESVLLDDHHDLRHVAAVHDDGSRRADLRPDGRHLRLRLGWAPLLALTVSPVLCLMLFTRLKPRRDNILVRGLRRPRAGKWTSSCGTEGRR